MPFNLDDLSDEEKQQLLEAAQQLGQNNQESKPPEPEIKYVQLPDGTRFEGTETELLTKLVGHVYDQSQQNTSEPAQKPLDFKEFQDKFMKDPVEGLTYAYQTRLGYDPATVLPRVGQVIQTLATEVQNLKTELLTQNYEELKNPENKRVVEQIIQERGWQHQNAYEDAIQLARAQNQFKAQEQAKQITLPSPQRDKPFVPHNIGDPAAFNVPDPALQELSKQIENMSQDELAALIRQEERKAVQ